MAPDQVANPITSPASDGRHGHIAGDVDRQADDPGEGPSKEDPQADEGQDADKGTEAEMVPAALGFSGAAASGYGQARRKGRPGRKGRARPPSGPLCHLERWCSRAAGGLRLRQGLADEALTLSKAVDAVSHPHSLRPLLPLLGFAAFWVSPV
jgi:hypothetical protein